ncbi:MAG: multi-sensor signal transduction histidine kinase [Candidatus Ozemobacter sibiricus]|jgi:K+-sensing histidine kinase KdpD|uniref:Multi-sensor signal transduction histidine kinase n=1 Tax=Candidatus Ozemobacter sibiricus TaxID=2268124 RepID=A0A367ZKA8_9BACT|nr:MAG: multi-sensor signal transduction histidine kinase [Candidatus Ozemobacter sibiricus]
MTGSILSPEQCDILLATWEKIASETEVARIIEIVSHTARDLTRAERTVLALIEGNKLAFVGGSGMETARTAMVRIDLGTGIPGKVAQDGLARSIRDGKYCSPVSAANPFGRPELPMKSMVCVAMRFQGQPIGVIQVINKAGGGNFTPADEYALQLLANQGAAAIERLRLHENAVKESQRIHGIFEALTDGIMVVDPQGNPLLYNKAVEEMFFPGGKQNYALTTYLSSVIQGESPVGSSEVVLFKPHNLILSNRYVILKDRHGQPSEVVISIRNTSDQRALDRRFSQFYAIMLHKSDAIVARAVRARDPRQRRRLLQRQKAILRNLLFLTELRSGPLRIEKENCDLLSLYDIVRRKLARRLARRRVRLVDAPLVAHGPQAGRFDRRRMMQVFYLLITRGWSVLKEGGEIWLDLDSSDGRARFEIGFAGAGVGEVICPEALDWNRQVDLIIAGEKASLDLDLSFIGHIVAAHKGSLAIEVDRPDRARVALALPLEL